MADFQTALSSCAPSLARVFSRSYASRGLASAGMGYVPGNLDCQQQCKPLQELLFSPAATSERWTLSLPHAASKVSSSHLMHRMEMLELIQGIGTLHPELALQFTEASI